MCETETLKLAHQRNDPSDAARRAGASVGTRVTVRVGARRSFSVHGGWNEDAMRPCVTSTNVPPIHAPLNHRPQLQSTNSTAAITAIACDGRTASVISVELPLFVIEASEHSSNTKTKHGVPPWYLRRLWFGKTLQGIAWVRR